MKLYFHKRLLDDTLPLSIGGGIGQSRLCMFYLRKAHIGEIQALVPLQRGPSGRISRLEIIGSSDTVIIGKELEIRKVLSRSHLKSSAFVIDYLDAGGNVLDAGALTEAAAEGRHTVFDRILLRGAGWGHGVGLCQIGAAVMASEGYLYKDILGHYYPGAVVSRNV